MYVYMYVYRYIQQDHPAGFYARPEKKPDNSTNLMRWETGKLMNHVIDLC